MRARKCKILELLSLKSFCKKELQTALQISEVDLEIRLGLLLSENSIIHKHNAYEITDRGKIYLESYSTSC
jgi:predicted transcriptional regulator